MVNTTPRVLLLTSTTFQQSLQKSKSYNDIKEVQLAHQMFTSTQDSTDSTRLRDKTDMASYSYGALPVMLGGGVFFL
jgi:hypothetical protein